MEIIAEPEAGRVHEKVMPTMGELNIAIDLIDGLEGLVNDISVIGVPSGERALKYRKESSCKFANKGCLSS